MATISPSWTDRLSLSMTFINVRFDDHPPASTYLSNPMERSSICNRWCPWVWREVVAWEW